MGKIQLSTLIDVAKFYNPIFEEVPLNKWEKCNEENSILYSLVYGESESHHEAILPYVKKGNNVLELFGGNAFESHLLSQEVKANFYSLDLEVIKKHQKKKSVIYVQGDALELTNEKYGNFDTVFIGGANASLCCIKPQQVSKLFHSVHKVQKKGGYFIVSLFSDHLEQKKVVPYYEESFVQRTPAYRNHYQYQFTLYGENPLDGSHQYFHCLILEKKGKITGAYYNTDNFVYYSHNIEHIVREANNNGYSLEKFSALYGERAIVFKKD